LQKGNPAGKRGVKTQMLKHHNKMDKKLKKVVPILTLIYMMNVLLPLNKYKKCVAGE
jgi:hypothetical protein